MSELPQLPELHQSINAPNFISLSDRYINIFSIQTFQCYGKSCRLTYTNGAIESFYDKNDINTLNNTFNKLKLPN